MQWKTGAGFLELILKSWTLQKKWRSVVDKISVCAHVNIMSDKGSVLLLVELYLTTTESHLPYKITHCYLPPDTSEHTPPWPQPESPVLELPTPEGWKAEMT